MSEDSDQVEMFWKEVEKSTGITKKDGEIILEENKSGASNLVIFVEHLIENEHILEEDIPIESGWKRYLVNRIPQHKEGEQMFRPRETSSGLYIETNYNLDAIKRKIRYLYNEFVVNSTE